MLSDAEQRRLVQIETSLRADDPRFARLFEIWSQPSRRRPRWGLLVLVIIVAAIGMAVAGLVIDNVAMVVAAVTVLGASFGSWVTYRAAR
jgi:Mg2+/citrate symporter